MPLTDMIVKVSKEKNLHLLRQIGGCCTFSSMITMFTGKMPSDWLPNGVISIKHGDPREKKEKSQNYWPWEEGLVIKFPVFNHIYLSDVRLIKIFSKKKCGRRRGNPWIQKPNFALGRKASQKVLLPNKYEEIKKLHEDRIVKVHQIQSNPIDGIDLYIIRDEVYHTLDSRKLSNRGDNDKLKNELKNSAENTIFDFINAWNFNEPDSIFWVFSDHGPQYKKGNSPDFHNYGSWVLFKDTTQNPIKVKSNCIWIGDFFSTISKKLQLSVKNSTSRSIDSSVDQDRIFYVEDSRRGVDKTRSTVGIACRFIDWKNNLPRAILQVEYYIIEDRFTCAKIEIDKNLLTGRVIQQNTIDSKLKKALIGRFKWIKK